MVPESWPHTATEPPRLVDPRDCAVGTIADTFRKYPEIGALLPAMGYGDRQIADLQATINRADADLVVIATPINLTRIITFKKPTVRVRYELQEIGMPDLEEVLKAKFAKRTPQGKRGR